MSKFITIRIPLDRAQDLQDGLSDIACWARGYVCALPPDDRSIYSPIGIEEVRDLNIILKGAIKDAETGKQDEAIHAALVEAWMIAFNVGSAARAAGDSAAHSVAAYIHDEIVNLGRRLDGKPPLRGCMHPFPVEAAAQARAANAEVSE